MQRTISAMVGKGSVNHNSRKFKAENVDGSRTHLNIDYCNEPIKKIYHELFDEALKRYNEKQTRADRRIENYYEKIRNSKQEKPFHELILDVYKRQAMYHVAVNGQAAGPFDKTILQQMAASGQLTADTLVWTAGMAQWEKAGAVEELKAIIVPPVPPIH